MCVSIYPYVYISLKIKRHQAICIWSIRPTNGSPAS